MDNRILSSSLTDRQATPGKWQRGRWLAPVLSLAILCGGGSVTYYAWRAADDTSAAYLAREFSYLVDETITRIEQRLLIAQQILRSSAGLFAAQPQLSAEQFQRYAAHLNLSQYGLGVLGIGFIKRVSHAELPQHIANRQREGEADYRVWPTAMRDEYAVITYVEPRDEVNRALLGYDLFSDPLRAQALARACDTGQAILSNKLVLLQTIPTASRVGFAMYYPIYVPVTAPLPDLAARRQHLYGWVYMPFHVQGLFSAALDELSRHVTIRLYDGLAATPGSLLFALPSEASTISLSSLNVLRVIQYAGHDWSVHIAARPEWLARLRGPWSVTIPWVGGTLSILLAVIAYLLARGKQHAQQLALQLNSELLAREAQYRHNHELLQKFSALVPGMLFQLRQWPNGRLTFPFVNDAVKTLYGLTPEEVSEDARALFERIHADDYAQVIKALRDSATSLQPWHVDYRIIVPLQGLRWLTTQAQPQRLGDGGVLWYGFAADITAHQEAELNYRVTQTRLNEAIAAANVGLWDWDLTTNRVFFSMELKKQLGYDETNTDEFAESFENFQNHLHPDDRERVLQVVEKYLATLQHAPQAIYENEFRFRHRDGSYRWILSRAAAMFDRHGHVTQVIGSHIDITERKNQEQALQEAKRAAEQASRAKSEFLANMSHEIRTPMNAVIGLSELALENAENAKQRDYLQKIHGAATALLGILNDILDYSKVEAGRMTLEQAPFDLEEVVDSLDSLFRLRAEEKHLAFQCRIDDAVPRHLLGDSLRLRQILANLLSNAIKFTDHGRVVLRVAMLAEEEGKARLRFSVSDTGIGISEAQRAKLFQPFSQADGSISRRFGGTGLGLVISRELLHLMGSDFKLDSMPGQGSTFSFELVLPILAEDSLAPNVTAAQRDDAALLLGRRILVVEDNPTNQQVVREFLERRGVTVLLANDGLEALACLQDNQVDAVLMDVHMPNMDGLEATRRLRAQPQHAQLPILALTAGVTAEEREQCLAAGMDAFIGKPIVREQLLAVLGNALRDRLAARASEAVTTTPAPAPASVTPQTSAQAETAPPLLDLTPLSALDDASGFIEHLLECFINDSLALHEQMQHARAQHDFDTLRRLVHTLKGSSGNVGAQALHQRCRAVEQQLKQGEATAIDWASFEALFEMTLETCRAELARRAMLAPPRVVNVELALAKGREIDNLLAMHEWVSDELWQAFMTALPPALYQVALRIQPHLQQFRFGEARSGLQALLRQLSS